MPGGERRMKKYNKINVLAVFFCAHYVQANDVTSHTFFNVRPQWQSDMPEKISFFHNRIFQEKDRAIEVGLFGSTSVNPKGLIKYFLPFNSCALLVAEAQKDPISNTFFLDQEQKGENIIAQNINIATKNKNFVSIVRFNAHQTVYGLGIDFKQRLGDHWWLEISAPLERVHNVLGFKEEIINDGGGVAVIDGTDVPLTGLDNSPVVANATQAFSQPNWNYGRMVKQDPLWGIADIELKIGLISCSSDDFRASSYAGVLFPTGNKPRGHVVFEEIIGNTRFFGFMFGQNIGINFGCRYGFDFSVELDMNSTYLFSNTQTRSFDPFDKSFGRYLAMYGSNEQAAVAATNSYVYTGTSGINLFTRRVEVQPRGSIDINSALVFERSKFISELGFNVWARQGEKVTLKNCCIGDIAIKDIAGMGVTNPTRGINTVLSNDAQSYSLENYEQNRVTPASLNLDSAAHPATLANILYASIGYKSSWSILNVGGSYEHGHINTTLRRWLGWGKIVMTF